MKRELNHDAFKQSIWRANDMDPNPVHRACHLEKDQGRKDDMETYLYTIFDLFHNERGLPWAKLMKEPKKIVDKKSALFANPDKELDQVVPRVFCKIIKYLDSLQFHDAVDYRMIESEIKTSRTDQKMDISERSMDWIGKLEKLLIEKEEKKKLLAKGEETLLLERLQKEARKKDGKASDDSLMKGLTQIEGSEGPPGNFNERALTTQMATQGRSPSSPASPMVKPKKEKH
uniref:Protein kinase domain-containing protein n=1 Tax=Caenorhabditis japonica TaxID=281687 RepID=A0A8R1DSX6_CAEJA